MFQLKPSLWEYLQTNDNKTKYFFPTQKPLLLNVWMVTNYMPTLKISL